MMRIWLTKPVSLPLEQVNLVRDNPLCSSFIEVKHSQDISSIFLYEYGIQIVGGLDLQERLDKCKTPYEAYCVAHNQIFDWADVYNEDKINLFRHILGYGKEAGKKEKTEEVLSTFERIMGVKLTR